MIDLENGDSITRRIKQGDHGAFRTLYKEYYLGLCIHTKRFVGNKEDAEEIVQDVFLRLWDRRETLDIQENIGSYLYQAVRNASINYLKHLQVVQKYNLATSERIKAAQDFYAITQENGQSIYIANEFEGHINAAIDDLPDKCRAIFQMSRFEGLKIDDIADKQGVTKNTVHKQISIALEKLREALQTHLSTFVTLWYFAC